MPNRKRFLKTNKDALRWCQNRRATIQFADRKDDTGKLTIQCEVYLKNRKRVNTTLIKTVNTWIKYFRGDLIKE